MKKTFFLLSLAISQACFCQFRLGVEGAGVYSSITLKHEAYFNSLFIPGNPYISVNQVGDTKPILTFSWGLVADEKIAPGFSIRLKLEYAQKGWMEQVV